MCLLCVVSFVEGIFLKTYLLSSLVPFSMGQSDRGRSLLAVLCTSFTIRISEGVMLSCLANGKIQTFE